MVSTTRAKNKYLTDVEEELRTLEEERKRIIDDMG